MSKQDKTPKHIKLDERNHVELPLLEHLAKAQDLLTGDITVAPSLDVKEARA